MFIERIRAALRRPRPAGPTPAEARETIAALEGDLLRFKLAALERWLSLQNS